MAIKQIDGTYKCSICGITYPSPVKADLCRDSHELVYVPMTKTELNRLLMAIQLGDMSLISNELLERLEKYNRQSVRS